MSLEIIVGCMRYDTPLELSFFNLEMTVEEYPSIDDKSKLRDFLNENTIEIVDDVLYVMDGYSGEMIWETKEHE